MSRELRSLRLVPGFDKSIGSWEVRFRPFKGWKRQPKPVMVGWRSDHA
jgi:hypothetical protein